MMKLPADKGKDYVWLEKNGVEKKTSGLLQCACNIAPSVCIRTYSAMILLEYLEPRFLLGLIPFLEETFKTHSFYVRMEPKHRVSC